ncbi:MAG: DEAD/DEAH box helicase, partial [Gammaproteobacteria bacterium]
MNATDILRVALPVPLPQLFDYLPASDGAAAVPGCRVLVPFGPRRLVGVVVETAAESTLSRARLQSVRRVLDDGRPLLDDGLLDLLRWCWQYYKHAPGDVVATALPPALRTARGRLPDPPQQSRLTDAGRARLGEPPGRAKVQHAMLEALADGPQPPAGLTAIGSQWRRTLALLIEQDWVEPEPLALLRPQPAPGPELTAEQAAALKAILGAGDGYRCHLLDGITGSGKTEVYMCLLERVLAEGGQALVLVPEIGLTPQLLRRFAQRLGLEPVAIHSGLAAGERLAAWEAARSGRAPLLVGT